MARDDFSSDVSRHTVDHAEHYVELDLDFLDGIVDLELADLELGLKLVLDPSVEVKEGGAATCG